MCDFDDDFGDGFEDGGFMDEDSFEEPFEDTVGGLGDPDDDNSDEVQSDEPCGPGWEDIAYLGSLSESIAEEKRRRDKIRREMLGDGDEKRQ